jgi:serine phosphatase RsbU (regulator of sigma subunit)
LEGNDSFLGPIADASYETYAIDLNDTSCILAYTDGIVDIVSEEEKPVGQSMLLDVLKTPGKTPLEKFRMIQKYITGPDVVVSDDCTLMLVDLA